MTESPSYIYYEFPEKMSEKLSYGANHPEIRSFHKTLRQAMNKGYELRELHELVDFVEERVNPSKEFPNELLEYLGLDAIEQNTGRVSFRKLYGKKILSTSKRIYQRNIVFAGLRPYLNKVHLVKIDEAIGSAELFVIRPKKELIIPEYLLMYLLSDLTLTQTKWILTGSSYPRLDIEDFKQLLIVRPEKEEQEKILRQIEPIESQARGLRKRSNTLLKKATDDLLSMLGINLDELEEIDYYVDFAKNENRLDYEYNNPKYNAVYQALNSGKYPVVKLEKCVDFLRKNRNPLKTPDVKFEYVDIGNVNTRFGEINSVTMLGKDAISSRMRRVIHKNNIIVSTTRPTRNAIAIVPQQLDNQICSTGFAVLQCKETISPDFLFFVLRSKFVTYQFQRLCSGSGYPEINQEEDLPRILLPKPDDTDTQKQIADEIYEYYKKAKIADSEALKKRQYAKKVFEHLILEEGSVNS